MRIGGGKAFGAAMIVGSMTIIGVTDNFVRFIAEDAGLWQFHLSRSALALVLLGAAAAVLGMRLRPLRPGRVAARSAVNAAAMLLYFGAIPVMPIAQVGAALFTAPIWVLLFSRLFFGHRIGPRRLLAVALGFAGVLVMLRPDPAALSLVTLMPLAAGAFYGLSNLLTREWCSEESVGALLGGFFIAMGTASAAALCVIAWMQPATDAAPFLLQGWRPVTPAFAFWIAVQATGALFAVGMLYRGYQSGETSALAVFEYSFLLSASGTAWLLWGETLDALSAFGMALIVAAGAVLAWRDGAAAAPSAPARP